MSDRRTIGRGEQRRDSVKLATGRGTFADDLALRGLLHAYVLTSPHAHARIIRIGTENARAMPGVVAVMTHGDLLPLADLPPLLSSEPKFVGDPIALVAAEDLDLARRAGEAIETQYETLPAVLTVPPGSDVAEATEIRAEVGDVQSAFAAADSVLERTYQLPRVAQATIEPQVVLAWLDEDQRLVVRTSSHVPFQVRQVLARRLALPVRRIRVLAMRDAGSFGGRLGVDVEAICASLVLKTGRPVRLACTREQEMIGPRAAHAQTITVRSATSGGQLVALDMTVAQNAGAAKDEGAAAALRAAGGVLDLYRCPNVRFRGRAYATNLPPAGLLRGDGASQAVFALESHIDELASRLGEDPIAFRGRCHVRTGDPAPMLTALGGGVRPVSVTSCGLEDALRAGARAIGWSRPRRTDPADTPLRHGVGVALSVHTPGWSGAALTSATIDMLEDGSFHLFAGTADLGAGSETVLCQIAAEVLDTPPDSVVAHAIDTDVVPFASGPQRASALFVSGVAVRDAALQLRARLIGRAAQLLATSAEEVTLSGGAAHGGGRKMSYDEIGSAALVGPEATPLSGSASRALEDAPPLPFAAVFAEVEVDGETGLVHVLKLAEAVDCGRVLNPQLAEARVVAGALQGLGYALSEAVSFDGQGRAATRSLRDYRLLSAVDVPEVSVVFVPTEEPSGPFGAKSIAEVPIHGVAAAIANAVAQAVGVRLAELPITPERVLNACATLKPGV